MTTAFLSVEREAQLLRALIQLQSHVNEVDEPKKLFEPMLDLLVEYSESAFGFIGEVHTSESGEPYLKTHAITNIAWSRETQEIYQQNAASGFEFRNLKSLFGQVLTTGEAVVANDPQTDPRRAGTPEGHPLLQSFMGLPFYQRGVMVGMVGVANRIGGYTAEIRQAMQPILASCAFIIDTFRIWHERQEFAVRVGNSEALHRGILDAAVDSIISIDQAGTIVSANRAVTAMFGYDPDEMIGQNVRLLMPQHIAEQHDDYIRRYVATKEAKVIGIGREVTGVHRSGAELPLELVISEVKQNDRVLFTGILRDISDRKRVEKERAEAYSQLVAVLDSCSQVSIIATDRTGLITVFNRGAENLLGYTAEEMIAKQTPEIIHDRGEVEAYSEELSVRLGRPVSGFQAFVAQAEVNPFDRREWTYVRADGSRLNVELTVTAVRDDAGQITGYLGVAVDVTARNKAKRDLIQAKEVAESANEAKSSFLANMSHEIRTPINGIVGMEELLRGSSLSVEQSEYVDALGSCAQVLRELVNEILDYSKIEAGQLEIHAEPMQIHSVLTETLEPLRLKALHKGVAFTTTIDPTVPNDIQCDPTRIRQILLNLVGNAVKFTDTGAIKVQLSTISNADDGVLLQFDVGDTGCGIPQESQLSIFDPFTQADSSTTRKFGGTGLGLSIAKRLVELLGGRIWFDSKEDQGTTFHFTVAARSVAHEHPNQHEEEQSSKAPAAAPNGLNVLLAEDHPVNQMFASKILQKRGHHVTIAGNGQEAIDLIKADRFDVVLMDIQMPVMDGLEAISRIRQAENEAGGPRLPIVALTAHAMDGYDQKCYAAGADAYISKPLRPNDLHASIEKLVASSDPAPAETIVTAEFADVSTVRSQVSAEAILDNTGHDTELAQDLIEIFQSDLPDTLQQLEGAIRNEDLELVSRLAHSLKSPLTLFGATAVSDHSHKLEVVAREGQIAESESTFSSLKSSLLDISQSLDAVKLSPN